MVFGWERTTYEVSEGDGEVELCAVILNGTLSVQAQAVEVVMPFSGRADRGIGE